GCVPSALTTYSLSQDELRELYQYDPDRAKSLLEEAGATDLSMRLMTFTGYQPHLEDIAQIIAADLSAIGIDVEIEPIPVNQGRAQVEAGNFDTVIQPHSTGVEPDEMFGGFTTGGARNFMGLSDP